MDAKGSDPAPPLTQSPLSPLGVEGFDGGPREKGNVFSSGSMGVRNALYLERRARHSARLSIPHEGSPTGPMERFCVDYTCGSGFSLLYVTEGRSPTSVYGGQGLGTLTRLEI